MNSALNPLGSTTIQKYLDEGEEKGKREVAVDMLKDGKPLKEIMKYTKFSEKSIEKLAGEYGIELSPR
ncbi:MAG: hypothetical protein FWH24_03110 [Oscillospiraceae bacterium]|nr:hypothetical protein [Oscillospiraceae bacterium]